MRSIYKTILSLLFVATASLATPPHYRLNVDFQKPLEPFQATGYQSSDAYYDIYFYVNGVPYTNSPCTNVIFAYQPFKNNKNLIRAEQISWSNNCAVMYMSTTNMWYPCNMALAQISFTNNGVRYDFADGYMTVDKSLLHLNPPAYPGYDIGSWVYSQWTNNLILGEGLIWLGGALTVSGGGYTDDVTWKLYTNDWATIPSKLDASETNRFLTTNTYYVINVVTGAVDGASTNDHAITITNVVGETDNMSWTNLLSAVTNLVLTNAPITYFAVSDGTAYYGTNDTAYASAADGALARGAMQTNYDGIATLANTNVTSLGGLRLKCPAVASASSQRIGFGVAISNAWLGANDTLVLNKPYFYRYYGSDDASGFLLYDAGNFVSGVDYQPAGTYLVPSDTNSLPYGISSATSTSIAQAVIAPYTNQVTGDSIAAAGGLTNTWAEPVLFPYYITATGGTGVLTRANGNCQALVTNMAVVITADATLTTNAWLSMLNLALFTGTNQVTWVTTAVTNKTTISTVGTNNILLFKGIGDTILIGQ